jgi:hypothetical protein
VPHLVHEEERGTPLLGTLKIQILFYEESLFTEFSDIHKSTAPLGDHQGGGSVIMELKKVRFCFVRPCLLGTEGYVKGGSGNGHLSP